MKSFFKLAALALCFAGTVQAATVNLTYNGSSNLESGVAVTGTGQFTTKDGVGSGAIGLDDLASFNFTFSFTYGGLTDTFNFGLSDLSCNSPFLVCDFSATLSDTAVLDLSLHTTEQRAQFNWSQGLRVDSLTDVTTGNFDMPPLSSGTMTAELAQTPGNDLPEPASWALAGAALAAGALVRRRRAI